ncbi:MAG TPA: hypothetical protein VKD25_06555 [Burkholderiales bacterium]|nr:hypothetical protein [Burkholderiales bacterium]
MIVAKLWQLLFRCVRIYSMPPDGFFVDVMVLPVGEKPYELLHSPKELCRLKENRILHFLNHLMTDNQTINEETQ